MDLKEMSKVLLFPFGKAVCHDWCHYTTEQPNGSAHASSEAGRGTRPPNQVYSWMLMFSENKRSCLLQQNEQNVLQRT